MASSLKRDIGAIFGDGGQSALARFLILAGDERDEKTIIRTLGNWTNEKHKASGEMVALLYVLRHPDMVKDLIAQARRELPPPMFRLRPAPRISAAPVKRK